MMRRVQLPAKARKAAGRQAMQSAASLRTAQPHSVRGDAPIRLPRGQLARAGDTLLALQRAYGNRHAQRFVSKARTTPVIQAKLTAVPTGDRYEREADQVARQVTQGTAATLSDLRSRVEQALGHDFSGVRLHNDTQADQLNRMLRARAFTTGQDIYLRRGEADLSTRSGQELIAHELTHVAQQGDGGAPAVQCILVQYQGPFYLQDTKTGIRAARIGKTNIWVGDKDLQDYVIVKVNGVETFALASTVVTPTQQTAAQPPTLQPPTVPPTTVQQTTAPPTTLQPPPPLPTTLQPPPPQPTTLQPPTVQQPTTGQPTVPPPIQIPPWNPPPISNPWKSPRGQTTYSFSPGSHPYLRGPKSGKYAGETRRTAAGYVNPKQFEKNMLPLWRKAAKSPVPTTVTDDSSLKKWLQEKDRTLEVSSPGRSRTKTLKGYKNPTTNKSAVVLGHEPSAGTHFNQTGHTQPRSQNLSHNKSTSAYHGLEDAQWSAQSGSKEPRYKAPRPDRGSHPSYYDSTRQDFTGGPWRTYTPVSDQSVTDYIEGKLNAVATAAAADPDYLSAVDQLAKLRTSYTISAARELLAMIKKKGW